MNPTSLSLSWLDYIADRMQHSVVGCLKVLKGVWSPQLNNRRDLLVYLPPSYPQGDKRYPVVYMHDGQNLFDRFTSFAGEWQVDETMEALSQVGLEAIVVGIPNMGERRLDEYSPFRDARRNQGGQGDQYIEFMAKTVKPLIDREFPTRPEPAQTALIGSSMGGLISLYGFFSCPQIFGLAGAMSPALWFGRSQIYNYVKKAAFAPGKIYMDVGTNEETGFWARHRWLWPRINRHQANLRKMCQLLQQKGYRPGVNLLYVEDEGAGHNEAAWAYRLPGALKFLFSHVVP